MDALRTRTHTVDFYKTVYNKRVEPGLVKLPSSCHVHLNAPTARFKSPKVNEYKGVRLSMHMTAISLCASGTFPVRWNDTVSHLCGLPMCVNSDHMCWESLADNVDRDKCQAHTDSFDQQTCPHNPKCIDAQDRATVQDKLDALRVERGRQQGQKRATRTEQQLKRSCTNARYRRNAKRNRVAVLEAELQRAHSRISELEATLQRQTEIANLPEPKDL